MEGHCKIVSVSSLATIPRPLDPENGRIALSTVSTFSKFKKRKLSQVATCIDGEAINIYNLQTCRLIASCAVPPQTKFLSRPCSLVLKDQSRRTYVVSAKSSDKSVSLTCLQDEHGSSEASSQQNFSISVSDPESIVDIDAISNTQSLDSQDQYEIILVRRNGLVESFSADLSRRLWSKNCLVDDLESSDHEFELLHAVTTTASKVQKTFLKDRLDALARLQSLGSGSEKSFGRINVLAVVSRIQGGTDMYLSLVAFEPHAKSQSTFGSHLLRLSTWKLPHHPEGVSTRLSLQCSFNLALGLLHVATSETIATYDFTQPIPKIMSILSDQRSSILSQVALPGGTLLTVSRAGYTVYDIKFNSILDQRYSSPEQQKKRKRDSIIEHPNDAIVVDFFDDLGLVAVLRGRELYGIQITKPNKSDRSSCLLVDALGRGVNTALGKFPPPNEKTVQALGAEYVDSNTATSMASWNNAMDKLGNLADEEDVDGFERLFAERITVVYVEDAIKENGVNGTHGHDDSKPANPLRWKFPDVHKDNIKLHRYKALSALRLIFKCDYQDQDHAMNGNSKPAQPLSIQFFPPNVFHWLVITGQLNRTNLEHAFRLYPSEGDDVYSLPPTSLIDAVVHFDPSLQLLFSVINHHLHLDVPELVQSIQYIIESLTEPETVQPIAAITYGDHAENGITNGDDHSIVHQADDAVDDVDFAISTLENGIPMRGEALRKILTQLNSHSNSDIADAFRQILSQSDLVRLMNILRLELEDSGWISRYIDPDPTAAEYGNPSNHAISIISKILGCAVDAIGINGWLAPSSEDATGSMDDLLLALRAETSIVLEGIHESTFMVDMLNQFLQYAASKPSEFTQNPKSPSANIKTLTSSNPELPLGLGLHSELSKFRISAGGMESRRSRRDIGRQISLRVPKYSFERIRI